jgi:O-acetyl-ADP-ribose deacetylase (regulator of RNase III)
VRVRAARSRPSRKEKEDSYDIFLLEDEVTLRVMHATKHLHVDLYVTDILRGLHIWSHMREATDALSWASNVQSRHLSAHHRAYPSTIALGRHFSARVYASGWVSVRNTFVGEICRFNATYAVYLATRVVEPFADERVDDWFLRIDCASMDTDDDSSESE